MIEFDKPRSMNLGIGCSNGCIYCYGRQNALRWKKIAKPEDWEHEKENPKILDKRFGKMAGIVMLPTTHDISHYYFPFFVEVLDKLLRADNNVLIVSKPNVEIMNLLGKMFENNKNQIMFRFTITHHSNHALKLWEPGAPSFEERMASLEQMYKQGYRTSVSIEPLLGSYVDASIVVAAVNPFVTDTIWIGKLNKGGARCSWTKRKDVFDALSKITSAQQDSHMYLMYQTLKGHPKVRWKDSIKKVVERIEAK